MRKCDGRIAAIVAGLETYVYQSAINTSCQNARKRLEHLQIISLSSEAGVSELYWFSVWPQSEFFDCWQFYYFQVSFT